MIKRSSYCIAVLLFITCTSCRKDVEVFLGQSIGLEHPSFDGFSGFYLLNEGNMGSNKSTLDYFDYKTGIYHRNMYATVNPTVPKQLGDVGNDIAIYGGRLYAVINASNKVEVMEAITGKRIGQVEVPNCRYIKFHEGFAYITSYAGPIQINPNYTQKGFVAKVDTASLKIVSKCIVGYQPDGLEITNGKIYVANSGGYMGAGNTEKYERTISVIDLATFKETKRIDVAYNLHHIKADKRGNLWVTSRGDYKSLPSRLFFIDGSLQKVTDTVPIAVSNYYLDGDSLYVYSTEWSHISQSNTITYGIVNTYTREIITRSFISDGTDKEIEVPYGIMVHPVTKNIYVTEAGNYVSPGLLYCFTKEGKKKWSVRTGDIPAHFALLPQ